MRHALRLFYIAFALLLWRARAFQKLGPSFIKLGQLLSTRPDLVGEHYAAIFAELRDQVPPFPSSVALRIIHEALGDVFASIDPVPVAAASIAQVHKARTLDGREVATKILRPNIEAQFRRDLRLLMWIARWVERLSPSMRRLKPVDVVQTFKHSVMMELDLRFEAANASELRENTKGDEGFLVPAIDWSMTTSRVLVVEWVEGIKLNEVSALRASGHDINQILRTLSESFFMQAFRDGFFHADMHQGNIFVNPKGEVVLVDFGIMGRLDWQTRMYVAMIFQGFLKRDFMQVARAHFDAGYVPRHHDIHAFASACRAIAMPILDKPVSEISIGALLGQLFRVTEQFEMQTRPELLLFQKNLVMVEGIGRMLNPHANMWELARTPIERWAEAHLGIKGKARECGKRLQEMLELAPLLLNRLEDLLRR